MTRSDLDTFKRQKTAEKILFAAEDLIIENGVKNLRARDVAAKAGCSVGSIYVAYSDFDNLILHVNSRTIADLGTELRKIIDLDDDKEPEAQLIELAFTYLKFARQNKNRWAALFDHRMPENSPLPDWHLDEHFRLISIIGNPLRKCLPVLEEAELQELCRTLYSAVHGIVSLGSEYRMGFIEEDLIKKQLVLVVSSITKGLKSEYGSHNE